MIEILHEYWKPLLWTDGYRFTGVAITLWLLILSVVIGGVLALFLAIGRVSSNKYIQFPIWLFTYIFRGTPLYVQLLVFYSGMYTLEIVKGTEFLNAFFRSGLNCTVLALTLNTCAYTTETNQSQFATGKVSPDDLLDYSVWQICSGKTLQEIYDRTRSDKWLRSHRA